MLLSRAGKSRELGGKKMCPWLHHPKLWFSLQGGDFNSQWGR